MNRRCSRCPCSPFPPHILKKSRIYADIKIMGEDDGTFSRLSLELSLEERANILEKLKSQSSISRDPLYKDEEESSTIDLKDTYTRLPWYKRFWFWLSGLFRSRSPLKLFEDQEMLALGKQIALRAPGYYDPLRGLLLPEFYTLLTELKTSARFFYTALDSSVNRDKGAFYAFLGSLEMGEVHRRLEEETNPEDIIVNRPRISEAELRQTILHTTGEILSTISDEERAWMYNNARSLACLKQLASFLYDRMLMAFSSDAAAGGMVCAAAVIRDSLCALDNILYSLREIPPMPLLESLFIFILQEHAGEQGFDINTEINRLLTKAETALITVRSFSQTIPLTLLCRCVCKDLGLSPREMSGGEDWFAVYQDYWKRQVNERLMEFILNRRRDELDEAFQEFFAGAEMRFLANAETEANPDGVPMEGMLSLSFLLTFHTAVFMPDLNKTLRPILIDGEFIKRDNRVEFNAAYNELISLEDSIARLEGDLAPNADLGMRYAQAKGEIASPHVKRRKMQIVTEEASERAQEIVEGVKPALSNMVNVLKGIAAEEAFGPYEGLSNLKDLVKQRTGFIEAVEAAALKFETALNILESVETMENSES